jgi:hypothetical protein
MPKGLFRTSTRRWLIGGLTALVSVPLATVASGVGVPEQQAFPSGAPGAQLPIVREARYVVNARIRPLALFWIGRDDVGDARFTWRQDPSGGRAYQLLVGSDPARTPRQINRWGFIAEEIHEGRAEVLGFMKGSNEETLDAATANADADQQSGTASTFKAVRTTVTGNRAVTGSLTFRAPPTLTYRQLDELIRIIPSVSDKPTTIQLPAGAKEGFLIAMTSIMAGSTAACREGRASDVDPIVYLYKQSLYDLRLVSCSFESQLRTKAGAYPQVVNGRFELRNHATRETTGLQLAYGTSGPIRDVPVRIVFRPRWWMEAELLLDQSPDS